MFQKEDTCTRRTTIGVGRGAKTPLVNHGERRSNIDVCKRAMHGRREQELTRSVIYKRAGCREARRDRSSSRVGIYRYGEQQRTYLRIPLVER